MLKVTAAQIAQKLGYSYSGANENIITAVTCDSRAVEKGSLFVALVGEKTDGHNFIKSAYEKGAVAVAASRPIEPIEGLVVINVDDGVKFLQELAAWVRINLKAKVIAVTGSYGKTTTKDMLGSVCGHLSACISAGNNNNELGLPLNICRADEETEILVSEMGMRGLGQIEFLCNIARPQYGIITNIGTVHSELLGSQEKIAQAKCELLKFIPQDGAVALNWQDKVFLDKYLATCKGKIIWYNCKERAEGACALDIKVSAEGSEFIFAWEDYLFPVKLNIAGKHNITNSLAVIVIALTLGVSIEEIQRGLAEISLSGMRLKVGKAKCGALVINDSYNANPEAMQGALQVLSMYEGKKKIAVLGDMYELGKYSESGHRKTGENAFRFKADKLIAVGELAKDIAGGAIAGGMAKEAVFWAKNNQEAIDILLKTLDSESVVLVKGSRGMKMEEIVNEIMG